MSVKFRTSRLCYKKENLHKIKWTCKFKPTIHRCKIILKYFLTRILTISTTYKQTKDKNLVLKLYTLFDSSRFSHSNCGSPSAKTNVVDSGVMRIQYIYIIVPALYQMSGKIKFWSPRTCISSTCWDRFFSRTCLNYSWLFTSNIPRYFLDFTYPLPLLSENEAASYLYNNFINDLYRHVLTCYITDIKIAYVFCLNITNMIHTGHSNVLYISTSCI